MPRRPSATSRAVGCPECGTPLFAGNTQTSEYIGVKVGALDDPALFKDLFRVWASSAPAWHHIDDSVEQYEKNFG